MIDPSGPPSYESFAQWLRSALDNLYDTRAIQQNPLIDYFGQAQMTRLQKSQNLRKILLQCIQTLNGPDMPSSSPDWLSYRILEMRYLDALSVDEVALELSISKSQFFRDQARAVSLLTDIVWDRYQNLAQTSQAQPTAAAQDLAQAEAERLSAQSAREVVDLDQLVDELAATIEILVQPAGLKVSVHNEQYVVLLSSSRVMLRQAVLILCGWAAARFSQGDLALETFRRAGVMGLDIHVRGRPATGQLPKDHSVDIARELLSRLGARLSFQERPGAWQASLEWSMTQPTVLVVDDDADIVALFRRYLVGYPWQVVGAANGVEARQQIETVRPAVILLDVMMPQEDGWEFLSALKRSAHTRDIPAIVCSVLTSPALALNLGASAYLAKPVSQQALIETLAHWSLPNPPGATGSG